MKTAIALALALAASTAFAMQIAVLVGMEAKGGAIACVYQLSNGHKFRQFINIGEICPGLLTVP